MPIELIGWQQNFNLEYVYCATSTQGKLPSKVTLHVLQADQRNVNSMAKYGSQLRYPYVATLGVDEFSG